MPRTLGLDPDLNLPDLPGALMELLDQVPPGKVTSYRALALALGDAVAARWVGHHLHHHPHAPTCPCHRVVLSTGQVGHYVTGPLDKRRRLEADGVAFYGDKVNLATYGFDGFVSPAPLARLRRLQARLSEAVSLEAGPPLPETVAGLDVSYASEYEGVAAYALVEAATGRLLWSKALRQAVPFPYISSYLTFRELPLYLDLLEAVRAEGRLAPVVLVDGTGILHPRHAGIASHLGVFAKLPTVGVTKKLLCGQVRLTGMRVGQPRTVLHEGAPCGVALKSKPHIKPIYLSPGHGVDLAYVERLIPRLLHGHKLPEPLYWADRLSRQAARKPDPAEPRLL